MCLDGGWQTLVDGLVGASTNNTTTNAKTKIIAGKNAIKIERQSPQQQQENSRQLITQSDGMHLTLSTVVLATDPKEAYDLFDNVGLSEVLSKAAMKSSPVSIAYPDVALSKLTNKNILFGL